MVATLVKLKLRLLGNSFNRSPWQIVGLVIGGLYGLAALAGIIVGLVALSFAELTLARTILVLAGAAAILGWSIIPMLASGLDMTLDPQRFVLFGIPIRQLMAGMSAAALVGVPGVVTVIALLATVIVWARDPLALVGALLGVVLALASIVIFSRAVATLATNFSASRRYREIGTVLIFVPLILMGPIITWLSRGIAESADYLPQLARIIAWTPFGAPFALPADVIEGNYGFLALRVLLVLVLLFLMWKLWERALERSMVTPPRASVAKRASGKLGFFAHTPATPAGAVAARAATYWLRDPRYAGSLVFIPLLPVFFLFGGQYSDSSFVALLFLPPLVAFLMAWSISADVSYDSTAFALHVATGVPGKADRWGRVLACALITVPLLVIFLVGSLWLSGRWDVALGLSALSAAVAMNGFGLSSVLSARYVQAVPKPGESPFKSPPGGKGLTFLVQSLGMLVLAALSIPQILLFAFQFFGDLPLLGWINLLLGVPLSAFIMWLGVRLGGRDIERRGPELLQQVIQSD